MAERAAAAGDLRQAGLPHPRYLAFLALFLGTSAGLTSLLDVREAAIVGFDLAVLAFLLSCVPLWRRGEPDRIRREADRDDIGRALLLLFTVLITGVVLIALSTLVLDKNALGPGEIALLVATLVGSWSFANTVYAFHYARLYYSAGKDGDCRGLDFPGEEEPGFSDFVNFAFVIGMTCQTADINITGAHMRKVATGQGLFAFVFNLGILALTVNVLASG